MIYPLLLLLLPLLGSIIVFMMNGAVLIKRTTLISSLLTFAMALVCFFVYRASGDTLGNLSGITEASTMRLHVAIDGISLLLIMLTTFLTPLIIAISFPHDHPRPSFFYGLILLMETALIGVFMATDGLLFYIFWELALIPAWLICAMWGGKNRIRITLKFFIYTFIGSLAMLGALIYVYAATPGAHSFEFSALYRVHLSSTEQAWIFWALFFAFAVKIPIFPFHTWQPDTYTQSPVAGTMLLAGLMLKMGTYGLIRVLLPIAPEALLDYGQIAIWITIAGIVYASIIAIMQRDMKRLIAYASIAHVGLIAAGTFTASLKGLEGAILQMLSHGINVVGLFFMIDIIERRTGTREIYNLGGIAQKAPRFAMIFMIFILASIALPMTNGFVGEFLLLLGLYSYEPWMAFAAGLTIIFGAVYMLWMYQRSMYGNEKPVTAVFADLSRSELAIALPLLVFVFWIGIFPGTFLHIAEDSLNSILQYISIAN